MFQTFAGDLLSIIERAKRTMSEDSLEKQLNQEIEMMSFNQLHELGNQAVKKGLIIGHGFFRGEYEILTKDETLMLTPEKAQSYLEQLLAQAEG